MNIEEFAIKLIFSIVLALILGRIIIPLLNKASIGQNVSEYGPESHLEKQGTPTMGGIIIALALIISLLAFRVFSKEIFIIILASFGFALVGFIDDFLMLIMKRAEGLTPKEKMLMQIVLGIIITLLIRFLLPDIFGVFRFPFINRQINLGILSYIIYPFVLVATVNAANLTDGLDGLLSSVSIPIFFFLAIVGLAFGRTSEFAILIAGAVLGFLAYNSNIASVFMGDTGSMLIGGAVGILSIITGNTFYLPIFGIIYVIEAGSVIIQVLSVKLRKGKRVFLMTPIHHGFEMKGYNEQKIVTNFAIVSVLACLLSLII